MRALNQKGKVACVSAAFAVSVSAVLEPMLSTVPIMRR
jgi:hypothetical protein